MMLAASLGVACPSPAPSGSPLGAGSCAVPPPRALCRAPPMCSPLVHKQDLPRAPNDLNQLMSNCSRNNVFDAGTESAALVLKVFSSLFCCLT